MFGYEKRTMVCKNGHKFEQTIQSGFFKNISPSRCPDCGSIQYRQYIPVLDDILNIFK